MKTEIAFILDRSGSMGSMTNAAISGFKMGIPVPQCQPRRHCHRRPHGHPGPQLRHPPDAADIGRAMVLARRAVELGKGREFLCKQGSALYGAVRRAVWDPGANHSWGSNSQILVCGSLHGLSYDRLPLLGSDPADVAQIDLVVLTPLH